jgi:hypothetical protein
MHDPSNPHGHQPGGPHGQQPHTPQQPAAPAGQGQPQHGQYVQPQQGQGQPQHGQYVQPGQPQPGQQGHYNHGAPQPAGSPGHGSGEGNKKQFIIGIVAVLVICGLVGIGVISESCGDDKSESESAETVEAIGVVGSQLPTALTKPDAKKKKRSFDVSMDEAFSASDFEYKVTKIRVARSVGGYARAAEGARFLTIFFDQKNTSSEPKKVNWFRDFALKSGDGKTYTASKVGSEAMLLRKRGVNYRETEIQSGIAFQGGVAFELPLDVIEDPILVFQFAHVEGGGKTRVLLQNPEIAKWILVEPYLRLAMANPTAETVKKAMGKTDASDSAIENYATSLKQFMDAYNTEVAERKSRRRSMKNLQVISVEQEGDMLTMTRLLKKKGKASERPKLKLVTKETASGDFVLSSIALSFGN